VAAQKIGAYVESNAFPCILLLRNPSWEIAMLWFDGAMHAVVRDARRSFLKFSFVKLIYTRPIPGRRSAKRWTGICRMLEDQSQ
jgi:hypothetical protein